MKLATATCDRCLDGRHIRCSERPCACTICTSGIHRAPTATPTPRSRPARRPITDEHIDAARELLARPFPPPLTEIARTLDVDRSALHRHLFPKGGKKRAPVPKLTVLKPITEEVLQEAARRVSAGECESVSRLAYDLGVERTGLYKHLKKREVL
jgi:DNA invertase Pin-like site-specific DNA recombinase